MIIFQGAHLKGRDQGEALLQAARLLLFAVLKAVQRTRGQQGGIPQPEQVGGGGGDYAAAATAHTRKCFNRFV